MLYKVIYVQPLGHLRLAVRFGDGVSREVEFRESHLYGVFEALKDPEFFQQVNCKQGFVEWPGELDSPPPPCVKPSRSMVDGCWSRNETPIRPNQPYQLDAVAAVTDLFDGQPQGAPEYAVIDVETIGGLFTGQTRTELGVGNRLVLPEDTLLGSTRVVQARNDKYERLLGTGPEAEWELMLFKNEELINYLTALQVQKDATGQALQERLWYRRKGGPPLDPLLREDERAW